VLQLVDARQAHELAAAVARRSRRLELGELGPEAEEHEISCICIEIRFDQLIEGLAHPRARFARLPRGDRQLGAAGGDKVGIGADDALSKSVVRLHVLASAAHVAARRAQPDPVRNEPAQGVPRRAGGDRLIEQRTGLVPAAELVERATGLRGEQPPEAGVGPQPRDPAARRDRDLVRLAMSRAFIERPSQAHTGEEDRERIAELDRLGVGVAQNRHPALEVGATGEVEPERIERPRLGDRSVHGTRDGERSLRESQRIAEATANHERVGEVGDDPRSLAGRRIDRNEVGGALQCHDARLPVA
jgi:hypothetical protein